MMPNRRKFSKEFKTKVVLESLKERQTIEALGKKYELHPNQISSWKAQAIANFATVFDKETKVSKEPEVDSQVLFAQIGQLKVENDFLKKKLN
jgi:transposase-like protein